MLTPFTPVTLSPISMRSGISTFLCTLTVIASRFTTASAIDYEWITLAGNAGGSGQIDGIGSAARFSSPGQLALDAAGNAWVTDTNNHSIRKITPDGIVTTVAGYSGVSGSREGRDALFSSPRGIAIAASGEIYISDSGNHIIRRISVDGVTTTYAGIARSVGSEDGARTSARFNSPRGLAMDPQQRLLIADAGNHTIRRIEADGTVTTVAGVPAAFGSLDGPSSTARFRAPRAIAASADGTIYVADGANHTIRRITPDGMVSTFAGLAGAQGKIDGTSGSARFRLPSDVTLAPDGTLRVADQMNAAVRIIATDGSVTTVGGADFVIPSPSAAVLDAAGNLIVSNSGGHTISRISPGLESVTVAGRSGTSGSADGLALTAEFTSPSGISMAHDGSLLVADTGNHTIRRISGKGVVTTIAGTAGVSGSADGPTSQARFNQPKAAVMDATGTIYVADSGNRCVRRISADGSVSLLSGAPQTLTPAERYIGPTGLAVAQNGSIYLADHNLIRRLDPSGTLISLAGPVRLSVPGQDTLIWRRTLSSGSNGDGIGSAAMIHASQSPWLSTGGSLYFTDSDLHTIRQLTMGNEVITLAGDAAVAGYSDGVGRTSKFSSPKGVALDQAGNLIVADTANHVIRRVDSTGNVTTIGGIPGYAGSGEGLGGAAAFRSPEGITIDAAGVIRVADTGNHRIVLGIPQPLSHPDNRAPRFTGYALTAPAERPLSISLRKILASVSDPDEDMLFITQAGPRSTAAGDLVLGSHAIDYTPAAGFTGKDELPVTVSDGRGGVVRIKLSITLLPTSSFASGANNPPTLIRRPDGSVEVTFRGVPRVAYPVQRSSDLMAWENLTTVTADATGKIAFIDLSPPATSAYYRLLLP